jgi:fluoride ion exporter CrcB/FEX
VGAPFDLGGAPMATRMVGGFILVAFLLCILLAWPGRRRWPLWLITGLCGSLCAVLTLSLTDATGWVVPSLRLAALALAAAFLAAAALQDLRDPLR